MYWIKLRLKIYFILSVAICVVTFQNCQPLQSALLEISLSSSNSSSSADLPSYNKVYSQLISAKCLSCHSTQNPSGNIDLSTYDKMMKSNVIIPYNAERSLIFMSVSNGSMPTGGPKLSNELMALLKGWINNGAQENELPVAECVPSKKILPRLSHYEYENILNDLLAQKLDATALKNLPLFPPLFGFDNISHSKIDQVTAAAYLNVAENMAAQILKSNEILSRCPTRPFHQQNWDNCALLISNYVGERLFRRPLQPSELEIFKNLFLRSYILGTERIRTSELNIDGHLDGFSAQNGQINGWVYDPDWIERAVEVRFYLKPQAAAGLGNYIGSALANKPRPDVNSTKGYEGHRGFRFAIPGQYLNNQSYTITVKAFANSVDTNLSGSPIDIRGSVGTVDTPAGEFDILFTDGLKNVLLAQLLSPNFLYKLEYFPNGFLASESFKKASKLALAFGSTYPDSYAWNLAKTNQYIDPAILKSEAQRLLTKYKARFSDSFGGQWLGYKNELKKDQDSLDFAMAMESKLVLEEIISNNQLASRLLEPGFSFLNSKLAAHYQINGAFSPNSFTQVQTAQRGGLLSQGQFLTRTATSTESHPIKRGIWVLDSVLCSSLPVLSAATFEEISAAQKNIDPDAPLSERMRSHRNSALRCDTCHSQIDPIGLALENWDKSGLFRTQYENQQPITSDLKFNGLTVSNPYQLASAIAGTDQFRSCVKKKIDAYIKGLNPTQSSTCRPQSAVSSDKSVRQIATESIVESLMEEHQ